MAHGDLRAHTCTLAFRIAGIVAEGFREGSLPNRGPGPPGLNAAPAVGLRRGRLEEQSCVSFVYKFNPLPLFVKAGAHYLQQLHQPSQDLESQASRGGGKAAISEGRR